MSTIDLGHNTTVAARAAQCCSPFVHRRAEGRTFRGIRERFQVGLTDMTTPASADVIGPRPEVVYIDWKVRLRLGMNIVAIFAPTKEGTYAACLHILVSHSAIALVDEKPVSKSVKDQHSTSASVERTTHPMSIAACTDVICRWASVEVFNILGSRGFDLGCFISTPRL